MKSFKWILFLCNSLVFFLIFFDPERLFFWIFAYFIFSAFLIYRAEVMGILAFQAGKNFAANVSHELRTPITIIRGFAEMLPHLSQEKILEISNKIVSASDRLDQLVKGLLRMEGLEHSSPDCFQACNAGLLIERCKHLLLEAYPEAEVNISGRCDAFIWADPDLLDLAILNLLENAVKYSSSPAKIQIDLQETSGLFHIRFQDEGIGIPASSLPYIFDRFYRVDKALSRKSGGVGLGLSMVKTIVEKHRGTIVVDSVLGKGTTFKMILPVNSSGYRYFFGAKFASLCLRRQGLFSLYLDGKRCLNRLRKKDRGLER